MRSAMTASLPPRHASAACQAACAPRGSGRADRCAGLVWGRSAPDHEAVFTLEALVLHGDVHLPSCFLVQQGRDLHARCSILCHAFDQRVQGASGVDDILDDDHVSSSNRDSGALLHVRPANEALGRRPSKRVPTCKDNQSWRFRHRRAPRCLTGRWVRPFPGVSADCAVENVKSRWGTFWKGRCMRLSLDLPRHMGDT